MKKNLKIILGLLIFIISFICIDGLCARFLDTRPIFAKKQTVYNEITDIGVVYKSLFADVYYCDTVLTIYNSKGMSKIEKDLKRYYQAKNSDFVCDPYISEHREFDEETKDYEYMSIHAEGSYKAGYYENSYNKKLNTYTLNFVGYYAVNEEYKNIYMFDVNDFSKKPIVLEVDGYDMVWRTVGGVSYSPSGNIMVFEYFCGYRDDQWAGEQKYTEEDCKKNNDNNGINVFRVNGINDYTFLGYFPYSRNQYLDEYKESYFHIYDIIDDENIIIKYRVTHNKQEAPEMEVYYKWNITDDTLTEWQV